METKQFVPRGPATAEMPRHSLQPIGEGSWKSGAQDATDAKTVGGFVEETVESRPTVYTDGSNSHGKLWEYNHDAVNHSSAEHVRGSVHTNSIEAPRSLFKRGFYGIYYRMTATCLQQYVREFTGRAGICGTATIDQMVHTVCRTDGKILT